MFNHANLTVYQAGKESKVLDSSRMATTMTITVFRNDQIGIGHIGDCRAYLVHNGQIKCMTTDHTHMASNPNLGMFTAQEALHSPMSSSLTRYIGKDPLVLTGFLLRHRGRGRFCHPMHRWVYMYM